MTRAVKCGLSRIIRIFLVKVVIRKREFASGGSTAISGWPNPGRKSWYGCVRRWSWRAISWRDERTGKGYQEQTMYRGKTQWLAEMDGVGGQHGKSMNVKFIIVMVIMTILTGYALPAIPERLKIWLLPFRFISWNTESYSIMLWEWKHLRIQLQNVHWRLRRKY